ncbi:MAG: hypothetical protein RBS19_09950 [Bacteroidales bacterium]|nr:hypothetical protein [Bacteroidales bacterium]MDY0217265.1 hypothetical protein [Bacteroidales bacterium]
MIKTILPSLLGILAVLVILGAFNLIAHNGDAFDTSNLDFFSYFVPITIIIALIIQFFITLPLWEKLKLQKKVCGLSCFQFSTVLCVLFGIVFGLVFWETSLGFVELAKVSSTGFIAFAVYWFVNLWTIKKLDK